MKMENATMTCQVFEVFPMPNGESGVILSALELGKHKLYLSYKKNLDNLKVGSDARFIEVPIKVGQVNDTRRMEIPEYLVDIGFGPIVRVAEGMRKVYLAHLYNRPLMRPMGGQEKKIDPVTAFSDFTLVLIQAAYKHLSGCDIHEVLRENDYQYERLPVYTSFHDDDQEPRTIYNTPRTLHYYPDINTIRVSWTLGGTPMDVVQYNDPSGETALYIKSQPFQLKIQRVYQNEGWMSLREAMKRDAVLLAFVKQFYANGYAKSGQRTLPQ
ncbi:hypothetical protein [Burkholderia phage FLC6]|nr:hypothetical protein [Burkholderia phage FLC6]